MEPSSNPTSRWREIRRLFEGVVELPPEERDRLLESIGARDPALRASVEKLLAADDEELLDTPMASLKDLPPDSLELQPGAVLGGFVIERLLGSGGMGVVYEARQHSPTRRVALKVMRPELGSRATVRRFEVEAEVLATMRHAGIAQVFAAGVHELHAESMVLRLPWYAMELVEGGVDLVRHARESQLGLAARLELFERVCEAVQHAHMRSVIHRDLKPANVLVDTEGRPKVIDFGIARGVARPEDVDTGTRAGQMIGTPRYMAPEQRAGSLDLDVRCDVFALGVLLGELLESAGDDRRRWERELGWILARARAEDRERRYASAAALAEDLQRLRRNEPVSAAPASRRYEWAKLLRRRWRTFTAIGLVLVSLLGGLLAKSLAWREADRERRTADAEREVARRAQEGMTHAAQRTRGILDLLTTVFTRAKLRDRGEDQSVSELLQELENEVALHPPDSPALEGGLWTYFADLAMARGEPQRAEECLRRALRAIRHASYPERELDAVLGLAGLAEALRLQGSYEEAQQILDEAFAQAESLLLDPLTRASLDRRQAFLWMHAQRHADATPLLRGVLEVRRRELGERDPRTLESIVDLGSNLALRDPPSSEASELLHEAERLLLDAEGPQSSRLLNVRNSRVVLLGRLGRWAESRDVAAALARDTEEFLGAEDYRTIAAHSNLAHALERSGDREAARGVLERVLPAAERTRGDRHPEVVELRRRLALVFLDLGRPQEGDAVVAPWCDATGLADREATVRLGCAIVRGRCLLAMHERERAVTLLRTTREEWARRFGPGHPEIAKIDELLR